MNKKISFLVAIVFIATFILSALFFKGFLELENRAELERMVGQSVVLGPLLIVLFQALQVIFVPIPGQLAGIISGYFFGSFWGTVYSMIGLTSGSFVAFSLARKWGEPIVKKFVPREIERRFHFVSEDTKLFVIFLIFLLPFFPDDAICFLCGLTRIKIRTLVLVSFLGRLPGCAVTNMIGDGIASSRIQFSLYLGVLFLIGVFFVYKNKEKIEAKFEKISQAE